MFAGVRKRPEREVWLSSSTRPVSDRPPVAFPTNGSHPNGSTSPNGSSAHAGEGDAVADGGEGVVLPPVDEGRVD